MDAGELVVNTVVNTKGAEKGLRELRKQLQATDEKIAELQKQQKGYSELVKVYEEEVKGLKSVEQEYDKVSEKIHEVSHEQSEIYTMPESKAMEIINSDYFKELNSQYEMLIEQQKELGAKKRHGVIAAQKLEESKAIYQDINNQLKDVLEKHDKYNDAIKETESAIRKAEIAQVFKQQTKEIGKSIKQIAKMGLAIFGIRSAYYMIRSAINDIGKSNKNVTDTISYAKTMLSTALEPVVIRIVSWLKQALAYINALVKAWFKRDLFAETNANLKKANKQASALKKTLTGFDEMNILNSTSTGGGGGISSSDLGLPDISTTGIFGWILNNKDLVISAIMGITTALTTMRLFGLTPLQGIFVALTTTGIVLFFENLIKLFNDPSLGTIPNLIGGLGIAISGIAGALTLVNPAIGPAGWVITGIGLIIGVLGTLIGHLRDTKEETFNLQTAEENLENSRLARQKAETQYIQSLKDHAQKLKDLEKAQKDNKVSIEEVLKKMEEEGLQYKDLDPKMQAVYEAYLNEQIALGNSETALKKLNEEKRQEAIDTLAQVAANAKEKNSYEELFTTVNKMLEEGTITYEDAKKTLKDFFSTLSSDGKKTFKNELPDYFKTSTKEAEKLRKELEKLYIAQNKVSRGRGGGGLNTSTYGAKGLILYPSGMPKLAVGGILNAPGRGIPYGGAIIGERGAEAVVPLTDSQQMELLGATIGRYITIQNTNPIYLNGRLIAKEINQANNESDFAYNR